MFSPPFHAAPRRAPSSAASAWNRSAAAHSALTAAVGQAADELGGVGGTTLAGGVGQGGHGDSGGEQGVVGGGEGRSRILQKEGRIAGSGPPPGRP